MFQTRIGLFACIALIPLSSTVHAGFITTGTATSYYSNTKDNVITQAFNLDDSATETFLDSFDLHVRDTESNTYHGVFFELETGTAKIISRTNLATTSVTGAHNGLVSFAVNQALDVTKTYGIGLYADGNGSWGGTSKSSDVQWTNHTFWNESSANPGNFSAIGPGHDWFWDFAATLHMSSDSAAAAPEPASLAMWSIMGGIGFMVRRKRKTTIAT